MKNHTRLKDLLPVELYEQALRHETKMVSIYGFDPGTRLQAAAHEAGHVLVGSALGLKFEKSECFPRGERWGGFTRFKKGTNIPFTAFSDPVRSIEYACFFLSGWAGEQVAGLCHPASSIDATTYAKAICGGIDDALIVSPLTTEMAALHTVLELLERHRGVFDELREHLSSKPIYEQDIVRLTKNIDGKPHLISSLNSLFSLQGRAPLKKVCSDEGEVWR